MRFVSFPSIHPSVTFNLPDIPDTAPPLPSPHHPDSRLRIPPVRQTPPGLLLQDYLQPVFAPMPLPSIHTGSLGRHAHLFRAASAGEEGKEGGAPE